ncbi:MAG: adenylate kinase [Marinilabiliaceae bacterium]|nr:adenylate kinase [Marinilabiliaceae bacterium]
MLNIVIFGPPGSGKGTQSENLIKTYQLEHVSTGDLLRHEISTNTQLGALAKKHMDKGELVPDEVIIGMIDSFLDKCSTTAKGVIFDGFPRTVAQAEALNDLLKTYNTEVAVTLNLEVPEDELITRLIERGKTSGRSDDNLDTIKSRLDVYNKQTKPVLDFYKKLGKVADIKGVGSIDAIFADIKQAVDSAK